MSDNNIIKKISIIDSITSTSNIRDIGSEGQNVAVSYDNNGHVIEDITDPEATVASTKSVSKAVKDINTVLGRKASIAALNNKADLVDGKVLSAQLPSYVDDVIEGYYNIIDHKFYVDSTYTVEIIGESGKIYVDLNTNSMFRWSGTEYVIIFSLSEIDLDDLTDVQIGAISQVVDGESLVYDSTLGKWVNKMATAHFITPPTVTIGTYTYNGQPQGPNITKPSADFDDYVITEYLKGAVVLGITPPTDAGDYVLRFRLKNTNSDIWSDLTTEDKIYNYTIEKATGSVTLSKNSVTLDADHLTDTVNVIESTGDVSVSSSDEDIAIVNYSNGVITITAKEETGETTVVVSVAASTNYTAASQTITVTASFLVIKSFNLATDAELKNMLDAYYADKVSLAELGWHVGDTRVMHFNEMDAPSPQASDSKWAAQDIIIEIVATEHTDLATPINGHNKACITVQTREVMNNNISATNQNGHIYINGDSSNDMTFTKWSNLYMRTYLNSIVLGAIPSGDFKSSIKQSQHYRLTTNGNNPTTADTTDGSKADRTVEQVTDTLFLPSYTEIFGNTPYSYYLGGATPNSEEGTQFEWYQTKANRVKQGNNNGNKNGTIQYWWEGSANSYYTSTYGYRWCSVDRVGDTTYDRGDCACGLAPAFAM